MSKPYIVIENFPTHYLCKVKIDDVIVLETKISLEQKDCCFEFLVKNVIRSTEDDELTKAIKVIIDRFRGQLRRDLGL